MLERAEYMWLKLLVNYCHIGSNLTCQRPARDLQLLLDASELIEVFEDLFPILLRPTHPDITGFHDWLIRDVYCFISPDCQLCSTIDHRHHLHFVKE